MKMAASRPFLLSAIVGMTFIGRRVHEPLPVLLTDVTILFKEYDLSTRYVHRNKDCYTSKREMP